MLKHSREKSNKCSQCDYATHNEWNLETHLKSIDQYADIAICIVGQTLLHKKWKVSQDVQRKQWKLS